jgi:hypothetical protein
LWDSTSRRNRNLAVASKPEAPEVGAAFDIFANGKSAI